jgi:ABC-2 type transport system permease protein
VSDRFGYARYELLRTFRNRRLYIFSFAFPLVLYYAIATPNRHEQDLSGTGISAVVYFMVSLAAFGAMNAVLGSGARIAAERQVGWNRQLRLTPLSTRTYFRVKVLTAYAMGLVTIVLLYVAGATLGVHLKAGNWLSMTFLLLIGLAPFAALGNGVMHDVAEALPSYWLVQAGHVGLGGSGWGTTGWLIVIGWTVACAALARRAYARDTQRV